MNPDIGIAFADALHRMQAAGAARRCDTQVVTLREARGRVLAEAVHAPMSLPSFDNAAMDGFALRADDLQPGAEIRLALVGERFAGGHGALRIGPGQCARITTGAAVPDGADTVVMKENARVDGDQVVLADASARGTHVRKVGEDVVQGTRVLEAGTTLGAPQLGLLAALGIERVPVARLPSVAVFTTGDELQPPGASLGPGQIFDSNRVLLQALLGQDGIDTLSWPPLPDDPARMRAAISDACAAYDVVITCGGVSAGEKDLLPQLLREHGRVHYWKVMMRPGMPVLFGEWEGALFLGLPGNPVSVLATFRRLALPLLDAMQGRVDRAPPLQARLREPVRKSHGRLEFRRARLSCNDQGELGARPHPAAGSHQQLGAVESNALMLLPEEMRELPAGALVEVEPYGPILRE